MNATGLKMCVAYFTTTKLIPQIVAIANSSASVSRKRVPATRQRLELIRLILSSTKTSRTSSGAATLRDAHLFRRFADAANLSHEGKRYVLGVFDAVQVAGLPTIHPRTHFVVRLKANGDDVGQHKLSFRWLNPLDQELWSSSGEMNVAPAPNPVFEVDLPIIAVVDLPLNIVGQYTMR